ncbi:adenine-specific DNA-methyltransferase [Mobilisporobacter senegalensis]|uniref:Adenine-specific DNA-methyltransferase n=1 Tax=Mobilisporobacter senegalensis TaxID=1329262 RepID=A0A3N1XUE8_9FIRM|nr:site-specific DNA-methyltransferase [Mobilisporobacter senegalensis]ROR28507.1 adenine-specific DNA-methyltransferase [Mobilisporobacter senegalensis]
MENNLESIELMSKEELVELIAKMLNGGVSLSFNGKRTAQVIQRKVMPRVIKINKELSFNDDNGKCENLIIDGENLQAMVTLYKYKGSIDLIVTDPPYNTGKDFRYNDKWDTDPNDPDLGSLVTLEDGSRHTKWMKFMLPRIQMMYAMLKSNGILAICIDERELFHLGMMLNEVFGEENRIGIINWQKSYAPKNDSTHLSSATEYVLVYAKNKAISKTALLSRTEQMNSKYKNPDNDPEGLWRDDNPVAARKTEKDRYAIQSPFTGALHYPGAGAWRNTKKNMKEYLEKWGSKYIEMSLDDGRAKALVIKGANLPTIDITQNLDNNPVIELSESKNEVLILAEQKAKKIQESKVIPMLYFLREGYGRPALKRYLKYVKQGKVPLTFWADEDYDELFKLDCQSWGFEESGHSQTGIKELDYILGKGHNFQTVKPLKLIEKIIQLWCPAKGIVLDPFAGSGTTGHAVLELNQIPEVDRKFILVEKGEETDRYASTLTRERIVRAIKGNRVDKLGNVKKMEEDFPGGFIYWELEQKVDAKAILEMKRDELIDVIISSHWEDDKRKSTSIIERIEKKYKFLVGKNSLGEGFFIIWNGKDSVGKLDQDIYMELLKESKEEGVKAPFHVYARTQIYQTNKVKFYQIPDKILMHLGLNENSDRFNNEEE